MPGPNPGMRKLIIALLAGLFPAIAAAQVGNITLPPQTVVGRSGIGSGPAQAIPFSQLIALMTSGPLSVPSVNTNSVVFKGATSGQATVQAQAIAGTPTLLLPNISGTIPSTATSPIILNPTTGAISCPTCSTSGASAPILASRAAAQALNLSTLTGLVTAGYAAAGDGGGATFKNIGTSAQPCDSGILTGTISAAGSAYTNGTYHAVSMTGGSGVNLFVNITVSGGGITAVAILNQGGNCFKVGDVLTSLFGNATIGGTGSGFTYTVSTISTPRASFTDSVGNKFQYVASPGSFIDPRAFGALFNFNPQTGDGAAHDDGTNIQAAINFAAYVNPIAVNYTTGTLGSGTVQLPGGSAMVCSSKLFVWNSVVLRGQGPQNTTLKICDTGLPSSTDNFITLCDPNAQVACFGAQIQDLNLAAAITGAPGGISTYMIYSNAAQQDRVISNVSVYGGKRGCFRYDTGFGGAAMVGVYDLFCTVQPNSISDGVVINAGTTMVMLRNLIAEGSYAGNAVNLLGGQIVIDGFHTEGIPVGVNVNLTVATHSAVVMNASGGNTCTSLVVLQSTNTVGNFAIFNAVKNGCSTNLVLDGQPSGINKTTDAKPSAGWVVFNP